MTATAFDTVEPSLLPALELPIAEASVEAVPILAEDHVREVFDNTVRLPSPSGVCYIFADPNNTADR